MRPLFLTTLILALACAGSGPASPGPATPTGLASPADVAGFPAAPEVGALEWLKGDPVDLTAPNGLVVVELWATWCGPCRDQFPHLSRLQTEHAGVLSVVGLSDEHAATVRPFVKRNGDEMGFTVAVDTSGETSGRWTRFAQSSSIPHAFLVQHGHVLWHGHPNGLDPVLRAALAGHWTPAIAADLDEVRTLRGSYHELLADGRVAEARAAGERVLALAEVAPSDANDLAWEILTEVPVDRRDLDLAVRCAEAASAGSGGTNANILDTYALALFESGRAAEAVPVQKKALELCRASTSRCDDFAERLARFEQG